MYSVRLSTSRLYLHATILDPGKRIELETTRRANSQSPRDNPEVVCLKPAMSVGERTLGRVREKKLNRDTQSKQEKKKEEWKDRYLRAL